MKFPIHETTQTAIFPSSPPPILESSNIENKISPTILLMIVIIAVIFFISGVLHLLVRYLLRPSTREPENFDNVTSLQGQLQQLFHLHDSGVDQSFIDTLPIFLYKAIIGVKDPFDCAVCLCEFEGDDQLRLLPKCSHAFHIDCIDTWLLSNSTCPLCRSSLVQEFSPRNSCSPVMLILEAGGESFRDAGASQRRDLDSISNMGFHQEDNFEKLKDVEVKDDADGNDLGVLETKVVQVKLGKFKSSEKSEGVVEGSSSGKSTLDERRCFSMGSYEYVMNDASILQVAIKPSKKKPNRFKNPGYAMSECDCYSRRDGFKGFDSFKNLQASEVGGSARISSSKKDSFSISKIWVRSKKEKPVSERNGDSSRRAFSFRLPLHNNEAGKEKTGVGSRNVSISEFEIGSEIDLDVEIGSCNNSVLSNMGPQIEETPSFARRTLMWIVGKQNKVGSHA